MRIVIIHRSFALVGGAERVIIDKANYLSQEGYQMMLVSYEQGLHPLPYQLNSNVQYKDLDCRFFTLSGYSVFVRLYHFLRLKRKFKAELHGVVNSFKPDVVVLASDWQKLINSVVDAAGDIPVIAEFHNAYDYIMRKVGVSENKLKRNMSLLYSKRILKGLRRCAKMVVLTESDARCWRQHFDNVYVIPNPVTVYPDVIDDIPKDKGRIIFVGRFNREKRIDRLIKSFSIISIGSGEATTLL